MYYYLIYTIDTWSMLIINNPILIFIYQLWGKHVIDMHLYVTFPVLFSPIASCHVTFHYPRNQKWKKIKSKKIDKKKRKSK